MEIKMIKMIQDTDFDFSEALANYMDSPDKYPHVRDCIERKLNIGMLSITEPIDFRIIPYIRKQYRKYDKQIPGLGFWPYPKIQILIGRIRLSYRHWSIDASKTLWYLTSADLHFIYFLIWYLEQRVETNKRQRIVKKEIKKLKTIGRS